nr:ribonuclease H-like domain, reverse transcriptase, RNA-dependent DNA polymerase [Tanacetum cinerariifolium]
DERGIVIKNKARLVAQGHTQEEGINYDEVFAPVARIEAIRLFLACASFKDFVVYQTDVKSAFLYGKIEEEVYVCQPLGFEDPNFPHTVYKVKKALYGLHQALRAWSTKKELSTEFEKLMHDKFQMSSMRELSFFLGLQVKQKSDGIFISQDKYVAKILKKFDFVTVKTTSTPMESNKPLTKDEKAENVDVHLYRSMIGSLMYLTTSRPNITFAVCACASLWYPKDSPFDLKAYSDSDYAGASLDRKSTTGGCQFLGKSDNEYILVIAKDGRCFVNISEVTTGNTLLSTTGQSNTVASAIICLADNQKFNFSKYIFDHMHNEIYVISSHTKKIFANMRRIGAGFSGVITPLFDTMMVQATADMGDTLVETHQPPIGDPPSTSRPQKKKSLGRNRGRRQSLQEHVFDLQEAKDAQSKEIADLKKKASLGAQDDASKQERTIKEIDQDDEIALDVDTQGRKTNDEMFGVNDLIGEQVVTIVAEKLSVKPTILAAATKVTTAVPTPRAKGIIFHKQKQSHIPTISSLKDKGKAKMIEPEVPIKKKDQIRMDEEYARQLKAEEQEAARLSRAQQDEEVNISWDNTQAMMEDDSLLAKRLQAREREEFSEVKKARIKKEAQESSTKRTAKSLESKISKKQKVDKNVEPVIDDTKELKKCMEIVPDDEDEVLVKATPISSRSPTIIDYKFTRMERRTILRSLELMVDHDVEMAYDLLRFIRKQLMKGLEGVTAIQILNLTLGYGFQDQFRLGSTIVDVAQVCTVATTITITTKEITLAQAREALKTSKPKVKGIVFQEPATKKLQANFDEEERLTREKAEKEESANIALIEIWDDIQAKIEADHQLAKRLQLVEGKEKRVGEELVQEITKKQKVEDDKEKAELKQLMETIPDEEEVAIDAIPLAVKSPRIIDWKIHKEGKTSYDQIVRADGKSQIPVESMDYLLWRDMKTMFEPHVEDEVSKMQQGYKVLEWKLEHGRMILESVENGPLIWPTVEENGVARKKKYAELSAAKKIQADYDTKATNIILQALPADIYSIVNYHRVGKDLWEIF